MTEARERAIKMYWEMAKEKCPFQTEEIVNGYLEGFIDCAELFEEEDKFTLTKYARIIIDKKDECIEELEKENANLKVEIEKLKYKEENYLQKIEHKNEVIKTLQNRIEKMKFWHDREEMVVIRDLLTEYIGSLGDDEYFNVAIFNVRNRLNGELEK